MKALLMYMSSTGIASGTQGLRNSWCSLIKDKGAPALVPLHNDLLANSPGPP